MPLSVYQTPGIYMEEVSTGARPIQAVGTSTAGFVGQAPDAAAHLNEAVAINNWSQFLKEFVPEKSASTPLSHAVYGFFLNGGRRCYVVNVGKGQPVTGDRAGLEVLETIDEVAIVAAPGYSDVGSHDALLSHCENLKDRVAILDPPAAVKDIDTLTVVASAPSPSSESKDTGAKAVRRPEGLRPRLSD